MLPLLISDVPLNCINKAAIEFHVPAKLIISIIQTEQGKIGEVSHNKNKTYDIGPMQINSSWLTSLRKYHITKNDLLYDPCKNVRVGTWLLAKFIAEEKEINKGIGNYNSHTKIYNQAYSKKVKYHFSKLVFFLNNPL